MGIFARSGKAGIPVLHPCHPMVCSGVRSSSWAEPSSWNGHTSSISIFLLLFKSRGFGFWFLFLVAFLSGSSVSYLHISVCYDDHFSLMYISFFPFLFLPLPLPLGFSFQAMCNCNQVLLTMIRLHHATAPHISPIYSKS